MAALFTGTTLVNLDETDSTNNYALKLLREKQPFEGTVVRTFRQIHGRGQRLKHWESEDFSNLTFSIIYYPVFLSVNRQFQLSKAIALGLLDFVKQVLKTEAVKIKWPNDIYSGDKKIAGILIENSVSANKISSSVIGIGLNVNQVQFSPAVPNPVSLKMLAGKDFDLEKCFEDLCLSLETNYMQLKAGKKELIDSRYHSALYGLNERKKYSVGGNELIAEITGVSEGGHLKLKTETGEIECGFHEVQYVM